MEENEVEYPELLAENEDRIKRIGNACAKVYATAKDESEMQFLIGVLFGQVMQSSYEVCKKQGLDIEEVSKDFFGMTGVRGRKTTRKDG